MFPLVKSQASTPNLSFLGPTLWPAMSNILTDLQLHMSHNYVGECFIGDLLPGKQTLLLT